MPDINFYIDAAKKEQGFKSDNQLQRALGYAGAQISYIRTGKSLISDEKMIGLAKLGNQDVTTALMDLNIWRASSAPVKKAYAKILHSLRHAAVVLMLSTTLFMGTSTPSHASDFSDKTVNSVECNYILWNLKRILKKCGKLLFGRFKPLFTFPYYKCQSLAY